MKTSRTDEEIDTLQSDVTRHIDEGLTRFPGQSYEEGIAATIAWLRGDTDDHPFPEN